MLEHNSHHNIKHINTYVKVHVLTVNSIRINGRSHACLHKNRAMVLTVDAKDCQQS